MSSNPEMNPNVSKAEQNKSLQDKLEIQPKPLHTWSKVATEETFSQIDSIPFNRNGKLKIIAGLLQDLAKKLRAIKEFEDYDLRSLKSIVLKNNYRSIEVLSGHSDWVYCLQFLPDGRIVSGSVDKTLRIWTRDNAGTWQNEVLSGHSDSVYCLQFLPDGRIVSGSADKKIGRAHV